MVDLFGGAMGRDGQELPFDLLNISVSNLAVTSPSAEITH